MSKHTPGPWRIEGTNSGLFIAGAKPGYLAEMRDCGSGDVAANARLIAAAPDLLDALALLVAGIENGVSDSFIPLVKARAAIAKATGCQS